MSAATRERYTAASLETSTLRWGFLAADGLGDDEIPTFRESRSIKGDVKTNASATTVYPKLFAYRFFWLSEGA